MNKGNWKRCLNWSWQRINLKGPIPKNIRSCVALNYFNVHGNRPSENKLNGLLPEEFGNLRSIVDINLSGNQLTGQNPQELGQLQSLVTLFFLKKYSLSGELPLQLADCFSVAISV